MIKKLYEKGIEAQKRVERKVNEIDDFLARQKLILKEELTPFSDFDISAANMVINGKDIERDLSLKERAFISSYLLFKTAFYIGIPVVGGYYVMEKLFN